MTVQQEILPPQSQDIIEQVFENPALAIRDEEKAKAFLVKVREHATSIGEKDMAKSKDRDEVRTMASKVTKSKTMLDKARLAMTAEMRKEIDEINSAGKVLTVGLAEIATEVRAPLTAWEDAEKEREELVESTIAKIKAAALVTIADTSASVAARGNEIYETEIDPKVFLKRTDEAEEAKTAAMKALHEAMHVLQEREDAKAELDAMKAAEAARLAKEAEEQAAREAKEREERLQQEAADRARREAEEAAEQQRLATEREAQRQIDEANRRAEQAEQEKQAELDRIAAEQAAAQRKADEEAAEQERRERSRKHRQAVMGKIKADIIEHGAVTEAEAVAIVKAMVAGKVQHVTVQF